MVHLSQTLPPSPPQGLPAALAPPTAQIAASILPAPSTPRPGEFPTTHPLLQPPAHRPTPVTLPITASPGQKPLQETALVQLPDWLKTATPEQRATQALRVRNWQVSLSELNQVETAASSLGYLRTWVQNQLINDLGYEIDPDQLSVSTERYVPVNGDTYTQTHSLTELANNGLQAGDSRPAGAFMKNTTLTYLGAPLGTALARLTPIYINEMIAKLPTPSQRRAAQQAIYTPQPLRNVADQRLLALADAAHTRREITPRDLQAIEQLSQSAAGALPPNSQVSTLKLLGQPLKDLLVVSHGNGSNPLWLLLIPGAPSEQQCLPFDNLRQLQQAIVKWSASPEMTHWLVQQTAPAARPALAQELQALKIKPYPTAGFFGLVNQCSYSEALDAANLRYLTDFSAGLQANIPDWYGFAGLADRQELNRLIEGLDASTTSVERLSAPVESFKHFLHREAGKKLNQLLGQPEGTANPDDVIVTSERETLSYTQLFRDGYDDDIGLLKATANNLATFSGPPGLPLGRLTAANVGASVRGQWVGDRYIEMLKTTVMNPQAANYETSRANTLGIMQLQLQAAALTSRLKGHISDTQAKWLSASLGQLDDSGAAARERFAVDPLRINIPAPQRYSVNRTRQEVIDGVYVFTQPDAAGQPERLLYTPNAPDGILFRDYARFASSLKNNGMPSYYQHRASAGDMALAGQGLVALSRGASLPTPPAGHLQSMRELFFDDANNRKIANVQESTTSKAQMIRKLTLTSLELIATGLLFPLQAAVGLSALRGIGAVASLARTSVALDLIAIGSGSAVALKDTHAVSHALATGDDQAAGGHALEAALNGLFLLLDIVSLGSAGKPAKYVAKAAAGSDALKTLQSISQPLPPAGMLGAVIDGERFWVNHNANALGHFELFRQGTDGRLASAGQFAQHNGEGQWSRIGLHGGGKSQSKPTTELLSVKPLPPRENLPPSTIPMASQQIKLPPHITRSWVDRHVVPTYRLDIGGRSVPVKYDFRTNTWRDGQGAPFQYNAKRGAFTAVNLPDGAALSEAAQNRALAGFGLGIDLPLRVPPLDRSAFKPVPRKIHSIWIGGAIPTDQISTIKANARAAGRNVPPLKMTLYLSIADRKVLGNIQATFKDCPNLKLQSLEKSGFYKDFKASKYFEQFKVESTGPAANQAAAVDTLRYQLLKHEGGIYMDVDDTIPAAPWGSSSFPEEALSTGEGQLLLTEPVSSEMVGMVMQYNTSTFGSLPGNPTLEALSEESFARYKANEDLFAKRPYTSKNTEDEMFDYINRISDVTGPGLFNDVIRKRLPQVHKYSVLQRFLQNEFFLEPAERALIQQSMLRFKQSLQPLNVYIGSAHSWLNQR